jgi:hypothetical protein
LQALYFAPQPAYTQITHVVVVNIEEGGKTYTTKTHLQTPPAPGLLLAAPGVLLCPPPSAGFGAHAMSFLQMFEVMK